VIPDALRSPAHPARAPLQASVVAAVAVGGALGACLRLVLTTAFPESGAVFGWTTFAINVAGSFLLALLPASAAVRRHRLLPPMLGTGLLGGFTTLSAYSEHTRALLSTGHSGTAAAYFLGTLVACLLAVAVGDRFSSALARAEFEDEEGDL
jgi:CrcB protein